MTHILQYFLLELSPPETIGGCKLRYIFRCLCLICLEIILTHMCISEYCGKLIHSKSGRGCYIYINTLVTLLDLSPLGTIGVVAS